MTPWICYTKQLLHIIGRNHEISARRSVLTNTLAQGLVIGLTRTVGELCRLAASWLSGSHALTHYHLNAIVEIETSGLLVKRPERVDK